ncbi:MAG: hypothetical protein KatS3mg119_0011 [Rhodothalassiaceae bacterium]|nr:MAG: hypothetical protein KatS3mg119_0011 [Rhodothalassiaceae bacterium]
MLRATGLGTLLAASALLLATAGARAQQEQPTGAEVLSEFLACDALALPADRLICYETALKAMKRRFGLGGEGRGGADLAPLLSHDRAGPAPGAPVRRTPLVPRMAAGADEQTDAFEATIVSAATDQVGHWIFTLDNGQVWKAADGTWLKHPDYAGKTVIAKRGWMGGWRFKIKEDKEVGRFKRIR